MTAPVRTCVACRTRRPQAALVRLRRRSDGVVVPAVSRTAAHGRSAYLCARWSCFDKATRKGALTRAFGRAKAQRGTARVRPVQLDGLWPQVQAAVDSEIHTLQRTGDISRSARYDALTTMRQELREPGRSA